MPPLRFVFLILILMLLLPAGTLLRAEEPGARRIVWQPVQRYFIRRQGGELPVEGRRRLNSFNAYTHLGTDFGFHGPAEHEIEWVSDEVKVHLGQQPDAWAGMWHSLAGQARHPQQVLDFARPFPAGIADLCQPRITQIMLEAGGRGRIKMEIKDAAGTILWEKITAFTDEKVLMSSYPLPVEQLRGAKVLVWTAEPGSEVIVRGIHLGVEVQSMPRDLYTFSACYAKLLRCHNLGSGFTRDRAHLDEGAFESIAATGLMLLATARHPARRDAAGRFVPLAEQDPARWHAPLVAEGMAQLAQAATANAPGRFQLEAAIQALHCTRPTDWHAVALLYEGLLAHAPTLGVRVGRAAAVAEAQGPAHGLALLDAIEGAEAYQPWWAVRAHLLAALGRDATEAARQAIALADDPAVRAWLAERYRIA